MDSLIKTYFKTLVNMHIIRIHISYPNSQISCNTCSLAHISYITHWNHHNILFSFDFMVLLHFTEASETYLLHARVDLGTHLVTSKVVWTSDLVFPYEINHLGSRSIIHPGVTASSTLNKQRHFFKTHLGNVYHDFKPNRIIKSYYTYKYVFL